MSGWPCDHGVTDGACAKCGGAGLFDYPSSSVYGGFIRAGCDECETGQLIARLTHERDQVLSFGTGVLLARIATLEAQATTVRLRTEEVEDQVLEAHTWILMHETPLDGSKRPPCVCKACEASRLRLAPKSKP